jgi:hypothetical protein
MWLLAGVRLRGRALRGRVAAGDPSSTPPPPPPPRAQRLFTPELAAFYEKFFADKGVTMVKGQTVTAFEGSDGKVGLPPAQPPPPL